MSITFKKSIQKKNAYFIMVIHDGEEIGKIWNERIRVLNRNSLICSQVRWFGELHGLNGIVGRGEFGSLLFGSGYPSQIQAAKAMVKLTEKLKDTTEIDENTPDEIEAA